MIGRLYFDFNENYGRVLIDEPKPGDIVDYLLLKGAKPFDSDESFLQNPSELFAVILMGAVMFGLDDALDDSLVQLDRSHFSFYIPSSYQEFYRESMEEGMTLIYQLGHAIRPGYGIWNVQDMRRAWCHTIAPLVSEAIGECDEVVRLSAALVSLTAPDRLAWFAVPEIRNRTAVPRGAD